MKPRYVILPSVIIPLLLFLGWYAVASQNRSYPVFMSPNTKSVVRLVGHEDIHLNHNDTLLLLKNIMYLYPSKDPFYIMQNRVPTKHTRTGITLNTDAPLYIEMRGYLADGTYGGETYIFVQVNDAGILVTPRYQTIHKLDMLPKETRNYLLPGTN